MSDTIQIHSKLERRNPMDDVRTILGQIIESRGYNKAAIARNAGISRSTLCDILAKRRRLEANEMFAICDAMGIEYSELKPIRTA